MRLEQEIKQVKPFVNEFVKATVNVMYTGNYVQDFTAKNLKEFDINDQHYNILRILKGRYPHSLCPGEIKEVLINKRGDLTRLIDKLVKKGLVNRDVNSQNRRMMDITINKDGLKLLELVNRKLHKSSKFSANLTEKEAKQLNTLLDKFRG